SVKTLMESGVKADILVCRTEHELSDELRKKLALFCNVKEEAVIQSIDASTIYDVPNMMFEEGLDTVTLKKLKLENFSEPDLTQWNQFLNRHKNPKGEVRIGLVGKYIELQDSYKSTLESFIHAGAENEVKVIPEFIHSEFITNENIAEKLDGLDGILVGSGFGERGSEGKIIAAQYARENDLPFLGIGLGMQMAIVEFARNVLKLKSANSTEMNPATHYPVVHISKERRNDSEMGGTMLLGTWNCELKEDSLAKKIYQKDTVQERHRHRYEFNMAFSDDIQSAGMEISGINPERNLAEVIEIPNHPWFLGVQFHPEYKSTVANQHHIYVAFVK